jgi:hypothetical protein
MIATSPNGMLHSFHISRIVAGFSGALLRRKSLWRIVGRIDAIRSTLAMESRTKPLVESPSVLMGGGGAQTAFILFSTFLDLRPVSAAND